MKNKYLPILLLSISFFGYSQTQQEKEKIAAFSNKAANEALAKELQNEESQRIIRLNTYLQNNPQISKVEKFGEFGKKEIMDVLPNGELVYARTDNSGAATTARANKLYNGGTLGINIQGQGMTPAVWDGGVARTTHQEFMVGGLSKITVMDGGVVDEHPTHVTGTIAAQGILATARGIAFNSSPKSYDWTNDLSEMLGEASTGLLMSNHSYGIGSLSSIWFYGAYDNRARQIDAMTFSNPYYLPVFSAGNDRGETTAPGSTQNTNKGGYDLIFGHGNAKNVLTVAAVNEVSNYIGSTSVVMSSFSSWGPSDDGRIKPEISMKGVSVRSTLHTSDTATGLMNGTSMASPGVTGVVTLLQQYYNQLYSNYMRAATVKGLIMHTADEAGFSAGPDYKFGWGLINAENAAKVIRDKNLTTNRSIIEENELISGGTYTQTISASGTTPLKISISWTDPAYATSNSGTTDPTTKYLVNDLDIKVTSTSGTIYYPWKLQGMTSPSLAGTKNSTNDVDNFERVDIANPSGNYTITVTHKGALTNGTQKFSLIASSENLSSLSTKDVIGRNELIIYPNPTKDFIFFNNNIAKANAIILDASGKIVDRREIINGKLDVQGLVKGNYMLIYNDSKGYERNFKFLKY